MSIFNSLFGNSKEIKKIKNKTDWIPLIDLTQLDTIVEMSNHKPIMIFKHSTRCGVSRMVLKQFQNEFDAITKIDIYLLDLLQFREVSNEIATRFGVIHQSPQLVLIHKGKSVYDVSHNDIDAKNLIERLQQ